MNYLFWNTNKKENVNNIILQLIKSLSCDIIGLAEYNDNVNDLLKQAQIEGYNLYKLPMIACKRLLILTKYYPSKIETITDSNYYTINKIPHDSLGYHLVAFVHLPSKLHADTFDTLEELRNLKNDIDDAQNEIDNNKAIILGDFNLNPFDIPMISGSSVHSLSSRDIVREGSRTIKKRKYSMFYNPMWNLLGDSNGVPGTYFYRKAVQVNYFWNMFDQVVISPSLIDNFNFNSLKIIDSVGKVILVDKKGIPNISDHLPIYFQIV